MGGVEHCIDGEIPFDIPETWCWARLNNIGVTQTGNTPPKVHPEYFGDYIPFIGPGDIHKEMIDYGNKGLSPTGINQGRVVTAGSVLQVCIGGSIGKAAINVEDVAFNQQINAITPISCDPRYILCLLSSPYCLELIKAQAGGTATPIINRRLWDNLLIPIAPKSEQIRIVEITTRLFAVCENL